MARTKKRVRSKVATTPRVGVVTLKKMAEEFEVSPQAFAILSILKTRGALGTQELKQAMAKKVETVQPVSRIWAFYKARLVRDGFISVNRNK